MMRIWTMTQFLAVELLTSFAGIIPAGIALAFGLIAFEYGMDQAQFTAVAGVGTGAICLLTTLLLASRANRASSYLLLARLHRRYELLVALVISGLGITAVLTLLITAGNLAAGRLVLDFPSALWIVPTWFAIWLLAATLALPLSTLTSQGGSHLVGYVLLVALLVANDRKATLQARGLDWLARAATTILWPVGTLLTQGASGTYERAYWLGLALTLAYGLALFFLASQLFTDRDLVWAE